jgi:DNA damage-inducible protein 1
VDLLFGLDMLKAHQACIDLEKNVLRIRGREVPFLSEHELPVHGKQWEEKDSQNVGQNSKASSSAHSMASQSFPGQGSSLGSQPGQLPNTIPYPSPAAQTRTSHPESSIRTIMDLGVTREVAISTLDAAGGNVDVAASLLF